MSYLTGSLVLKVYTDTAQTEFPKELVPSIQKDFSSSAVTAVQETTVSIAASSSQTISLNGLTSVTGMYIFSDTNDISVTINGGASLVFKAQKPGYLPVVVTSLSINNNSSTAATTVSVALISG